MKSPLGALFGLALFTFVTIGFLCVIGRALILKYDGAVAVTKVTKTDYSSYVAHNSKTVNSPYSVQYRFQVPGSSRWYEHYEPMLVGQPVASVDKDTWLAAKKTGTIRVVYARFAPSFNLPGGSLPGHCGDFQRRARPRMPMEFLASNKGEKGQSTEPCVSPTNAGAGHKFGSWTRALSTTLEREKSYRSCLFPREGDTAGPQASG